MRHPESESRAQPRRASPPVLLVPFQPIDAATVALPLPAIRHSGRPRRPLRLKSGIEHGRGAVRPGPGRDVELTKNQVRMKLECPKDSVSYYDSSEGQVEAPRNGVRARHYIESADNSFEEITHSSNRG